MKFSQAEVNVKLVLVNIDDKQLVWKARKIFSLYKSTDSTFKNLIKEEFLKSNNMWTCSDHVLGKFNTVVYLDKIKF